MRSIVAQCYDDVEEVMVDGAGYHWYRVLREEDGFVTVSTCERAGSGTRIYVIFGDRCA